MTKISIEQLMSGRHEIELEGFEVSDEAFSDAFEFVYGKISFADFLDRVKSRVTHEV